MVLHKNGGAIQEFVKCWNILSLLLLLAYFPYIEAPQ
jgi:hypothetical protein